MKHKNLFLKIYIPFVIITVIALIVLQFLGSKKRIGYLTDFNLNIERTLALNNLTNINESFTIDGKLDEESIKNYLLTNENITNYVHHFRIRYYDKVFRNSDIYGVYIDLSNLPEYMENAEMEEGGSPYGNFIAGRKTIEKEKIDNVSYILKVKFSFVIIIIIIILFILFILYIIRCNVIINDIIRKNLNEIKITGYLNINKILNIAFYLSLFILSVMILSSQYMMAIMMDDWMGATWYIYNIYEFKGEFWHRGRHFGEIIGLLATQPFGNILISFGFEPFYTIALLQTFLGAIFYFIMAISFSLFIWILNEKKNFKLIFLTIFLFILNFTEIQQYYGHLAPYIGAGGISLIIWMPMLYFFIYEKEFILSKNIILHYSMFVFLIYFATFAMETSTTIIAGLSLFMIVYFLIGKTSLLADNNSRKPSIFIYISLILFILFTLISFILTLLNGRGKWQLEMVKDTSYIENILNAFYLFNILEKLLIMFAFIFIIILIYGFIKNKKISKVNYIYFSILFVGLLGIFGFSAIQIRKIILLMEFLLIFSIFILQLLKNIDNKNIFSVICCFVLSGLIIIMGMQVYINYNNNFKNISNSANKSSKKIVELFIEADKLGLNEIVLYKKDIKNYKLENQSLKEDANTYPNINISYWMLHYGYTKKIINIRVID